MLKKKIVIAVLSLTTLSAILLLSGFVPDGLKSIGIDLNAIDKSVKPGDDFYQYSDGTWLKNNPVPADQSRWGSFDMLQEENSKKILTVVKLVAADKAAPEGSNRQKLRDFYNTIMDSAKIEKQGITYLQPEIDRISKVESKELLIQEIAHLHQNGFGSLFGFYVSRDLKKSDENVCYFAQDGLGLPDIDYYLKNDEKNNKIRDSYLVHVANMLKMMGRKEPEADAKTILSIETELAQSSMSRLDRRDEEKTYNRFTFDDLNSIAPNLNLKLYLSSIGAAEGFPMIVNQPEFFKRLNSLIDSVPMNAWQAYLSWNLIHGCAGQLNSEFVNENFNFYGKTMNGTQVQRPRWKRALGACDGAIGEIVGQAYVEKYFPESSKKRVGEMVKNILAAYKIRIENLEWMSAETKEKALVKLSMFNTKLGYPDKWRDYSGLTIKTDSYVLNMMRANKFDFDFMMARLGKPVDKSEWGMLPHQVNAYYDPTLNEVVFPAAIMQAPFFFADADDAVNYGAIGAAIGHEITHGFDDQGAKYDGFGNLNEWWTEQDRKEFDAKKQVLIEQYSKYEVLPELYVNGELTIGENIADLGGISTAYQAYQSSLKGKPSPVLGGFTGEQRFFIAFGQVWKVNTKEEYLRKMVLTDVHSPGKFRTYTVSNLTEFYSAFKVKDGMKMYRSPETRAKIW